MRPCPALPWQCWAWGTGGQASPLPGEVGRGTGRGPHGPTEPREALGQRRGPEGSLGAAAAACSCKGLGSACGMHASTGMSARGGAGRLVQVRQEATPTLVGRGVTAAFPWVTCAAWPRGWGLAQAEDWVR